MFDEQCEDKSKMEAATTHKYTTIYFEIQATYSKSMKHFIIFTTGGNTKLYTM